MLPDKIKFLGHEYRVVQVNANRLDNNVGEVWFRLHEIRIDEDAPESRKESALLHEIIEIINAHFELNLEHHKIECLEETLYTVLKDNDLLNFNQPKPGDVSILKTDS